MKAYTVTFQEAGAKKTATRTISAETPEHAWQRCRTMFPGCHVVSIVERGE